MTNTKLELRRHTESATAGLTKAARHTHTYTHTLQEVMNNESLVAKISQTHIHTHSISISISLIQLFLQHYRHEILIVSSERDRNMFARHCITPNKGFLKNQYFAKSV